jgi:hypothetical protein
MIVLTSFQRARRYPGRKYFVARFRPRGFIDYSELDFFAAEGEKGEPLSLYQLKKWSGRARGIRESPPQGLRGEMG